MLVSGRVFKKEAGFDPPAKLVCWCTPVLWRTVVADETVVWRALHSPLGARTFASNIKNLPDAGGTVIKEAVLSKGGPFIALGSG